MSYAFNRSVSTMGYAKAVVNIQICQRSKLFSKVHIVLFFFFVEAQVFQKQELTCFKIFSSSFSHITYTVRSKGNLFTQQFAKMFSNRCQSIFRINFPFRTTKMSHTNYSSIVFQQIFNGVQGSTNSSIIRNITFSIKGNVKINTYQYFLTGNV